MAGSFPTFGTSAPAAASSSGGFFSNLGGNNFLTQLLQMAPAALGGQQQQQLPLPPQQGLLTPRKVGEPNIQSDGDHLDDVVTPSIGERIKGRTKLFVDNTDDLFSSQGKVLGLGLLNQVDPKLMWAAIVANGLLAGKKDGN